MQLLFNYDFKYPCKSTVYMIRFLVFILLSFSFRVAISSPLYPIPSEKHSYVACIDKEDSSAINQCLEEELKKIKSFNERLLMGPDDLIMKVNDHEIDPYSSKNIYIKHNIEIWNEYLKISREIDYLSLKNKGMGGNFSLPLYYELIQWDQRSDFLKNLHEFYEKILSLNFLGKFNANLTLVVPYVDELKVESMEHNCSSTEDNLICLLQLAEQEKTRFFILKNALLAFDSSNQVNSYEKTKLGKSLNLWEDYMTSSCDLYKLEEIYKGYYFKDYHKCRYDFYKNKNDEILNIYKEISKSFNSVFGDYE